MIAAIVRSNPHILTKALPDNPWLISVMSKLNYYDCHCHLLPGLDDGPKDIAESVEIAHILNSEGFTDIACTPHLIKGTFDNDDGKIRDVVTSLQEVLTSHNIDLTLHHSVEYRIDEYLLNYLDDPMPIGKNIVLIELSPHIQHDTLLDIAYTIIVGKKLKPLIAHPERHDIFNEMYENERMQGIISSLSSLRWPVFGYRRNISKGEANQGRTLIEELRDMGCLFQGNIGSFAGTYGNNIRKTALSMLKKGLYDCFGTDAHGLKGLSKRIRDGLNVIRQEVGSELDNMLRPAWSVVNNPRNKTGLPVRAYDQDRRS